MSGAVGSAVPAGAVATEDATAAGTRPASRGRVRRARDRVRALPGALWVCMLVAVLNAAVWSLIMPTFQGPDEPAHVGYVQYVGETGKIPRPITAYYAPSEDANTTFNAIPWSLTGHPSWSPENDAKLQRELRRDLDRVAEKGAGYASNNPPLYYLLAAVPYRVAHGGTFLDRMYAMRFLSVLLAGLTVGFVFMFLRELLPRRPWAWAVGALAVAFQPVFGFIGGVVNIDNLLWVECAAVLWLLARSFRRGLTIGRGVAIGAFLLAGMLTKGSMFAFLPGVLLALALMVVWPKPAARKTVLMGAAAVVGIALGGFAVWYFGIQPSLGRSADSTTSGLAAAGGGRTTLGGQLSYLWQFYLPRLPSQSPFFAPYPGYPLWDTVIQGFVGRFGWFQYGFPEWVSQVALGVFGVIFALAVTELVRCREAIKRRWREVVTFVVLGLSLVLLIAVAGYRFHVESGGNFEQARYYFPLIAFYGAIVALAARGVGRRFGPAAGVVLVVLAVAQGVFAQLITLERYFSN